MTTDILPSALDNRKKSAEMEAREVPSRGWLEMRVA